VEVPGGERWNVQTGEADTVSTTSLIGCSTSVALAKGPTNEGEEEATRRMEKSVNTHNRLRYFFNK